MTKAQTPAICLIWFDRLWSGSRAAFFCFCSGLFATNAEREREKKSPQMLESGAKMKQESQQRAIAYVCAAAEDHRLLTCWVRRTLVKVYSIKESILEQQ